MVTFIKAYSLDGSFKWTFEGYEVIFSFDQPTYCFHAKEVVFSIADKAKTLKGLDGMWYGYTLHSTDGVRIGPIFEATEKKAGKHFDRRTYPLDVVIFPYDEPALQFFSLLKSDVVADAIKLQEYLDINWRDR
jgi:hypothetical protein